MADLKKKLTEMKVVELRTELEKLGMNKNGAKIVLVERLLKHLEVQATKDDAAATTTTTADQNDVDSEDNPGQGDDVVVEEILDQNDDNDMSCDNEENGDEEIQEEQENEEGDVNMNEELEENVEEEESEEVPIDNDEADTVEDEAINDEDIGDVETQVIDDHDDKEPEVDAEAEALNISVDENEQLTIDEESKAVDSGEKIEQTGDEKVAENDADDNGNGDGDDSSQPSINTSTSMTNEAVQDSKTVEGENEEALKNKETERHIILVTGLSSETSANDLKTFFRKHGKIGRIKIMTNTRVPGAQRFAHISVMSLDDLNHLVETLNGAQLKGKTIRVSQAPDGSISKSYDIAVAAAQEEADGEHSPTKKDNDHEHSNETAELDGSKLDADDVQVIQDTSTQKEGDQKDQETENKSESPEKKKEEKKDAKESPDGKKKSPEKKVRPERNMAHASRKPPHERPRGGRDNIRNPRNFRREKDAAEWRRHGPPNRMEVTRVHRDRVPINRPHIGPHHPPIVGGRRRSPHAPTLTFDQIREIRDEQRKREIERRKREEERERVAEMERQKRLEYQNYMEFKQLEREREKLRMERERIEKEKQELIRLERERQKSEREKIEREKEELRRAKMNIEHHSHRSMPMKRPYEEEKERRRESVERKKPYGMESERRVRPEIKTEAERKMERERYERERLHAAAHSSSRSPLENAGLRESRRDVWASEERERASRKEGGRSGERGHRRDSESGKSSERRAREAPSRAAAAPSDLVPRYALESSHSSTRGVATSSKRPSDRYEDSRATGRDDQWMQRSSYLPGSSLSLPMGSSTSTSRDSWPMNERKLEAWETARLPARTDQWISGAGTTVGTSGRSSLPVIAPPPPMYSHVGHQAAALPLPGSGLGLGSYSSERYDSYKGGFHHLRRF
ncbi:SAFB-like transcription modulator [Orchesella cincta]|uniref:SAFB-like transcription modulator n=1 Tax=Orchesella cincta TaxID=48709 RepID=A0A1D2N5L1_ORCCI|nr:SAFB-like transcription modulator [Orchesella cincta]